VILLLAGPFIQCNIQGISVRAKGFFLTLKYKEN
jgi:hypothetical protein